MSDRMRKRRGKLSEQGMQVVEIIISKELVSKFNIVSKYHGVSRSSYLGATVEAMHSTPEFGQYYYGITRSLENRDKP
jgi:hypothetical protein